MQTVQPFRFPCLWKLSFVYGRFLWHRVRTSPWDHSRREGESWEVYTVNHATLKPFAIDGAEGRWHFFFRVFRTYICKMTPNSASRFRSQLKSACSLAFGFWFNGWTSLIMGGGIVSPSNWRHKPCTYIRPTAFYIHIHKLKHNKDLRSPCGRNLLDRFSP